MGFHELLCLMSGTAQLFTGVYALVGLVSCKPACGHSPLPPLKIRYHKILLDIFLDPFHHVISLFISSSQSPSLHLSFHLIFHLSISPFVFTSLRPTSDLFISFFICLSNCSSLHLLFFISSFHFSSLHLSFNFFN